jgi:hypothetical protein
MNQKNNLIEHKKYEIRKFKGKKEEFNKINPKDHISDEQSL